uniref:Globin family profile domain-containing protein n=1 Tax=Chromera velia CCMP2878 TaxID=1169474 RepID=A0A0G4H7J1_9ALVE|eukprot:Cvel_24983.t1-p1 / transcript=Cvel_24983.t1 / gene=Cvel_24983 / organism=Chromera_velia_CCMP2878 / gene_product=hypothetical protein / transcript_product=hypothetical protein / location=Cvel_scaffold2768:3640-13630(+) / protein_length=1188 / sequence_SO=supercontig / SO=protein_coding / is_pseudo=false
MSPDRATFPVLSAGSLPTREGSPHLQSRQILSGNFKEKQAEGEMTWLQRHALQVERLRSEKGSTEEERRASHHGTWVLQYDILTKTLPDPALVTKRGKTVMGRAFVDTISTMVAFASERATLNSYLDWVALRHVHYGIDSTFSPLFKSACLSALEQILGDQWDRETESAWSEAFELSSKTLMERMETMQKRLKHIREGWDTASKQLGVQAMEAKVAANLMVASLAAAQGREGASSRHATKQASLAKGVVALLGHLVDAVFDLQRLRGVTEGLLIPYEEIFEAFGAVPSLKKTRSVAVQTMEEVVGVGRWTAEHEEAWTWLWGRAVEERQTKWTRRDRDKALEAWAVVERILMREVQGDERHWKVKGRDYWRDNESSEDPQGEMEGEERGGKGSRRPSLRNVPGDREELPHLSKNMMQDLTPSSPKAVGRKKERVPLRGFLNIRTSSDNKGNLSGREKSLTGFVEDDDDVLSLQRKEKERETEEQGEDKQNLSAKEMKKLENQKKIRERLEKGHKVSEEVAAVFSREFFKRLSTFAPSVHAVFVKSEEKYTRTIKDLLGRLLAYIDDPSAIWSDDEELAMRHVIFGVMPTDIPLYNRVMVQTMAGIAGGEWNLQHDAVWTKMMGLATETLSQALVAALHPITRALVTGSPDGLIAGLRDTPRGERASWACSVTISGEERSPIYWMIEAGFSDLASILMRDVLALRCNKSGFYCGRFVAFSVGKRRVVFYLKELWGDSRLKGRDGETLFPSVASAPLTLLTNMNETGIAAHPVVDRLVNLKWDLYAKRRYLQVQCLHFAQILSFSIGYIWAVYAPFEFSMVFRAVSYVMPVVSISVFFNRVARQRKIGMTRPLLFGVPVSFQVPFTAGSSWNLARLISSFIQNGYDSVAWNSFGILYAYGGGDYYNTALTSLVSILLWIVACEMMLVSEDTAAMLGGVKMLGAEFIKYMAFVFLVTLGFASALANVAVETPEFATFEDSFQTLISAFAGAWEPSMSHRHYPNHTGRPTVELLIVFYKIISTLIFAQSLLAIMIVVWQINAETSRDKARLARAELVVEVDSMLSTEFLNNVVDGLKFDQQLFLDDDRTRGPSGGVEAWVEDSNFKIPGLEERHGRASRLEVFDSELGPEAPWPEEERKGHGGEGGAGGDGLAGGIEDADREIKNMRGPATKVVRFVRRFIFSFFLQPFYLG